MYMRLLKTAQQIHYLGTHIRRRQVAGARVDQDPAGDATMNKEILQLHVSFGCFSGTRL